MIIQFAAEQAVEKMLPAPFPRRHEFAAEQAVEKKYWLCPIAA